MRWRLGLVVLLLSGVAAAQEDTPTATPVNTATPTITHTYTPTVSQPGLLANQETCASAPCNLPAVRAGAGVKTIAVQTNTGTATVLPICVNGTGWLQSEVSLGSLSGATCTTAANCLLTTVAWCDDIYLRITTCGSSCRVTGWLRTDEYHQR